MKRLLIVDDDIEFLQLLFSVLEKQFEVYTATGVKVAMQVLNTSVIDAVCSDFNMRDGTGLAPVFLHTKNCHLVVNSFHLE